MNPKHRFASMFTYEIWGDRVRSLDMPYSPLQPHGVREEILIIWRILKAATTERALLLRTQIGWLHPDVLSCFILSFVPHPFRPLIALAGDMWLPSSGARGVVERLAIRWADRAVNRYLVFSTEELTVFPRLWGVSPDKVRVCVYKYTFSEQELSGGCVDKSGPIFAGGSGGRDWRPLVEAAAHFPHERFVFATRDVDQIATPPANVQIGPIPHANFVELMRLAKIVIVPIARDLPRAVGQQTYLNSMYLRKPTIVADGLGVHDHINNGEDAIIVDGTTQDYVRAIGWILDSRNTAEVDALKDKAHWRDRDFLIIAFTHPAMMTRYGCGAVRAQA